MNNIHDIEKFWNEVLLNKTITKVNYDRFGLSGFFLNDGTKVGYEHGGKGLYIVTDNTSGKPIKYS